MSEKVSIAHVASTLKSLSRTGWMLRGVPRVLAETVAEHSYLASLIALDLAGRLMACGVRVDPFRTAALALLHDVAEAFVGDIVKAYDELSGEVKSAIELKVVEKHIGSDFLLKLYREFYEGRTTEALVARICDYLATYVQATYYEKLGYEVNDIKSSTYDRVLKLAEHLGLKELIINYIELSKL